MTNTEREVREILSECHRLLEFESREYAVDDAIPKLLKVLKQAEQRGREEEITRKKAALKECANVNFNAGLRHSAKMALMRAIGIYEDAMKELAKAIQRETIK